LLIIFLLVGAVLAARANLRSGRADVRGAFRLAAFMFTVIMATWLLDGHVRHAQSEMSRFFAATGIALFLGGVMYLIYLGLEPWVRRTSPLVLVGWSRVLAGRLRDPLVGRDVLIGVACGAVGGLLNLIPYVVSRWAGLPEMEPFSSYTGALDGVRPFLRDVVQAMNGSLQSGLIAVFEWVSFRMGIELLWNRGVRRVAPSLPLISERAIIALAMLLFVVDGDPARGPPRLLRGVSRGQLPQQHADDARQHAAVRAGVVRADRRRGRTGHHRSGAGARWRRPLGAFRPAALIAFHGTIDA
jgi:hypothetical protein